MDEERESWKCPPWVYPCILISSAVLLLYRSRALSKDKGTPFLATFLPTSFLSFQRKFLTLFLLASVAEGLQTVYGESFLEHRGLKREDIASIIGAAYGASLFLGPLFGVLTDHMGRKKACVLYCFLQILSCLAKHTTKYSALWIASIIQGLATSLFLCAFETWMIVEHEKLGFRPEWASDTFCLITFGGAVAAIGSGALANFLVNWKLGGIAAPSTAAAAVAGFSGLGVILFWEETSKASQTNIWGFAENVLSSLLDKRMVSLGWIHGSFDFASTVFWFLWTPTLVADGRELHSGMIYSCLLASEMLGSIIAAMLLCGPWNVRPEDFLRWVFLCAALSLMVPAYDYQEIGVLVSTFCVFHICHGIAWPSLARLRSIYIPTEQRSSIMSLFRGPVNAAVLFILINGSIRGHLENSSIFVLSIIWILSGIYCLHLMNHWRWQPHEKASIERP